MNGERRHDRAGGMPAACRERTSGSGEAAEREQHEHRNVERMKARTRHQKREQHQRREDQRTCGSAICGMPPNTFGAQNGDCP